MIRRCRRCWATSDQLVQVFLNLVKNAVEAIAQGGEAGEIMLTTAFRPGVRLSVPGTGERMTLPLEVCVHDTGPGVPEELRPQHLRSLRHHQARRAGPWPGAGRQDRRATMAASSNAWRATAARHSAFCCPCCAALAADG